MNIFEIDKEINELVQNNTDIETGEMSEKAIDELMQLDIAKEKKIDNIVALMRHYTVLRDGSTTELERLTKTKKIYDNKVNRLKDLLVNYLEFTNSNKVETSKNRVTIKTIKKMVIKDDEKLQGWLEKNHPKLLKQEIKINKKELNEICKKIDVPFVEEQEKKSIIIK